ncbi:MAG TPA: hypothetical protein DGG95_11565 [Cytophagales bacterium]|jgi:hypothetical protein|nr:hypothetical protein [Cytophagales bacterium]
MKYKNYKSAIHNFAHSFMSIDYMKSGRLAVNVLIDLHNQGLETKATFDFVRQSIEPIEAKSKESKKLLADYLDWLPDHFSKHNCDLSKLERLEVTISIDFDKAITPLRMNDAIEFVVVTSTNWKADGRDDEEIEIKQTEVIKRAFLKSGIPEFN